MSDKLELLRIKTERVLVGEREMILKTSTLVQQKALATALGKVDPGPLLAAVQPVLDDAAAPAFVATLTKATPEIYRAAMSFLATSAGDAVAEGVSYLLDNEQNFGALVSAGVAVEAEREGGRYVGSAHLRALVSATITPRQALHVLVAAIGLNDYGALGGALAALVTRVASAAAKSNAKSTPAPESGSSEGLAAI